MQISDTLLMFCVLYVRFGSLDILFDQCCICVPSYDVVAGQGRAGQTCVWQGSVRPACDALLSSQLMESVITWYSSSLFCKSLLGRYTFHMVKQSLPGGLIFRVFKCGLATGWLNQLY